MEFCKQFNEKTKDKQGLIMPVVITVYEDRSFTFVVKSAPASVLLKRAAGIAKASGNPKSEKVGKVTLLQVKEIAKEKFKDLNCSDMDAAVKQIKGSARSMGIDVVEE